MKRRETSLMNYFPGASCSTNNAASNNCGRVKPGTSTGVDRPRMRGNRGDDDFATADAKPRNFLNKVCLFFNLKPVCKCTSYCYFRVIIIF